MAILSGLAGQYGIATETTAGTFVTPAVYSEFVSEDLKLEIDRAKSAGISAGRRVAKGFVVAGRRVNGSVTHELVNNGIGRQLRAMFGGVSTTGAGPYTHTFTPGDLGSFSVQVGRPGTGGTVHPFSYTGMRVASWELTVDAGTAIPTLVVTWMGMDESTSESLGTFSAPSVTRFSMTHASLSIAGSAVCIDNISVSGDNGLEQLNKVCAADAGRATVRESGWRAYTGSATADFVDLTQYNRFKNATEVALSLVFNASASAQLTIAGNVHFTGETPNVSGPEVLKQPIPFEFVHATSDASAITATLINSDSAA